jgi:hypothetical protein
MPHWTDLNQRAKVDVMDSGNPDVPDDIYAIPREWGGLGRVLARSAQQVIS